MCSPLCVKFYFQKRAQRLALMDCETMTISPGFNMILHLPKRNSSPTSKRANLLSAVDRLPQQPSSVTAPCVSSLSSPCFALPPTCPTRRMGYQTKTRLFFSSMHSRMNWQKRTQVSTRLRPLGGTPQEVKLVD